jgi:hypothetical protein
MKSGSFSQTRGGWQALNFGDLKTLGSRLWRSHPNYRERKAQPQFVAEINLNMMQSVLLKLDATEVMHVRRVPFHLLEHELHFRLSNDLLLIHADNPRLLLEFSRAAAPTRPNAKAQTIDWQRRRRDYVDDADEGLHPIEFAADIFAQQAALQVGKNYVGLHGQSIT